LPDTITPIAVTSANAFGGLTAGDYRIVAIQSLGSQTNSQQIDLHIDNQIVPVTFSIAGQPAAYCGTTASMTVNATQGNPVMKLFRAVTFPPQASSVFSGLPPGDYVVGSMTIVAMAWCRPITLSHRRPTSVWPRPELRPG
jgi:hypothetical protein